MTVVTSVVNFFHFMFTCTTEVVSTVNGLVTAIIDINHDFVTSFFNFLSSVLGCIGAIVKFIGVLVYTIVVCIVDFLAELINFVQAFLYLAWKVLVLVYSILDLLFHFVECMFYFLWTGGKWTAEAIQISAQNLTENGLSTWIYFVFSIKDFTNSVIGGFSTIGYGGKVVLIFMWDACVWCFGTACELIYTIDAYVRVIFSEMIRISYQFLTEYIVNIPKEAYLGVILCILAYIAVLGLINFLCSRGLTFPLLRNFRSTAELNESEYDYDEFEGRLAEFSDDDYVDLSHDEDNDHDDASESSDDTVSLSSNETEDSNEELDVNSDDDESNTASESEMSEINIQLPGPETRYNLRRSETPSRSATSMSPGDLEKQIETEKEKRKCVVCQDRNKSVLILPCRHMCLCVECGNQIARSRVQARRICPLCRAKIKTIMNVYL